MHLSHMLDVPFSCLPIFLALVSLSWWYLLADIYYMSFMDTFNFFDDLCYVQVLLTQMQLSLLTCAICEFDLYDIDNIAQVKGHPYYY